MTSIETSVGVVYQPPRGDYRVAAVGPLRLLDEVGRADSLGLDVLIDRLSGLAEQHGPRFMPADPLLERAREGGTFFE
jgi:hypothetical protein